MKTLKGRHKAALWATKYLTIFAFVGLEIHVGLLLLGYDLPLAEGLCDVSLYPFILINLMSYAFGFCILHRLLVTHSFVVTCCIQYQRWLGFGSALAYARWTMFILGLILLAFVVRKGLQVEHG